MAGLGLWLTGCDGGGGDSSPPSAPEPPSNDTPSYDVTGRWSYRDGLAIYVLKQHGTSVQGKYYNPQDPSIHGDIAGSVHGDEITLYVVVTYDNHPEENFTARKDGIIHNDHHMTLVVTQSPHYQGQRQEWYRL